MAEVAAMTETPTPAMYEERLRLLKEALLQATRLLRRGASKPTVADFVADLLEDAARNA